MKSKKMNKKIFFLLAIGILLSGLKSYAPDLFTPGTPQVQADASAITAAVENKQSNIQVTGTGRVSRLLRDDLKGSKHQKFILALPAGGSILIAHNIDLSPRIDALAKGDEVSFNGEYEWNKKGGVVHWTHRDPRGRHPDGWLRHKGVLYQ
jgi:hypothetical protein